MNDPVVTTASAAMLKARKAGAADLPELSRSLAAAFFDDPVFSWWIADDAHRREILPGFFGVIAEANLKHDEIYAADNLVGGAVWNPPHVEDDEEMVAALAEVSGGYAETLFEVFELMMEKHPQEPHYYLFFLGTRPEWQSRGVGSSLMRPVLQVCDERELPAYLEATDERNVQLYLRHGFELTGEIPLRDGPSLWPMWREPR
jgi:ribosomal protein S18 acetylase RimI-like enzyme